MASLFRACHPEPTAAVTVLVTALAVMAGRGAAGSMAVAVAVLAGQLSVGWSNDAVDAHRDTACGRRDKPVASGAIPQRWAAAAAGTALALCVPLSLLSGVTAGAVHVTGVLAGWAYNLVLKRTVLSPLPYAVGFASLPAFITLGLRPAAWPAWWAVTAAALLGVAAHLVNVLPDIGDDLAAGVRGLPQRLGPAACRWVAPLVMLTATGVLVAGPTGEVRPAEWALGAVASAVTVAGTALPLGSGNRWPFRAVLIGSGIAVSLLLLRGADMV